MSRICPSCGGIIGRDCFNPQECQWITDQMERQNNEDYEANRHHLQEPPAEEDLSAPASPVEGKEFYCALPKNNCVSQCAGCAVDLLGDGHSPVEDLPQTENPLASYWFEKARQNLVERNDFKAQLNRANDKIKELTESKPSPVIEIGEKWEPEEIEEWIHRFAECDADNDATLWINGANAMYRKLTEFPPSHPAPDPIVGEGRKLYCQREIEGNLRCAYQCDHCRDYYQPLESKPSPQNNQS